MHIAGLDYNATTISLALNPWSTTKTVFVGIIDDNVYERFETFRGQLVAADILPGNVYLEPTIATATIYDYKSMYACVIVSAKVDIWSGFILLSSYCAGVLIGFNTSVTSSESNGTVALVVNVFNMTIGEGNSVRVRITTADESAHGRDS